MCLVHLWVKCFKVKQCIETCSIYTHVHILFMNSISNYRNEFPFVSISYLVNELFDCSISGYL